MQNKKLHLNYKVKKLIQNHIVTYPTPINLNYNWSFGFLTAMFMIFQFITGILLAIHYISYGNITFENMEFIMRDVNFGWLIRYMHANSASFIFICLYAHILRGIFYKSYTKPRHLVWFSGVILLLISILTAFIGYVLPWGQMSYWGATVITNLVTAFPIIGKYIILWLWGGYTVSGVTLVRFFNFHYIFAILVLLLIIIHLTLLHEVGSSNSLMLPSNRENIKFYRFYYLKDLFGFLVMFILYLFITIYYPNLLGHSDNYIKANSFVTPTHIVPEWYFLPFYAVLRSFDNKLLGVLAMIASILILCLLSYCKPLIKNIEFTNSLDWFFWSFTILISLLWLIGMLPAEYPYVTSGKIITKLYFLIFVLYYFYIKFLNTKLKYFMI